MDISIKLNESQKHILKILYLFRPYGLTQSDLKVAFNFVVSSDYNAINLLKILLSLKFFNGKKEDNEIFKVIKFKRLVKNSENIYYSSQSEVFQSYNIFENGLSFEQLIGTLVQIGLIEIKEGDALFYPMYCYFLTDEGERITNQIIEQRQIIFRPIKAERQNIFIASVFGNNIINLLYDDVFKPACLHYNHIPFRVDKYEENKPITELIIKSITESEVLIADLTFARPSVYFEIGYAHGLGIPILLTCRKDHFRGNADNLKVHFDLEQYKISYWDFVGEQFIWSDTMNPLNRLGNLLNKV